MAPREATLDRRRWRGPGRPLRSRRVGFFERYKRARAEAGDMGATAWPTWAAQHGWRYEEPADELIGRFVPPEVAGDEETCPWAVYGAHKDLEFVLFFRWARRKRFSGQGGVVRALYLAVKLPRLPRADLRATPPETTFENLGGNLSGRFGFDAWQGAWMLGGSNDRVLPYEVEGMLEHIAVQLAFAPEEIWES
jgi:hypothetical protein